MFKWCKQKKPQQQQDTGFYSEPTILTAVNINDYNIQPTMLVIDKNKNTTPHNSVRQQFILVNTMAKVSSDIIVELQLKSLLDYNMDIDNKQLSSVSIIEKNKQKIQYADI